MSGTGPVVAAGGGGGEGGQRKQWAGSIDNDAEDEVKPASSFSSCKVAKVSGSGLLTHKQQVSTPGSKKLESVDH